MAAPEDRIYCSDEWCDGDHLFAGERCNEPEADEEHPDDCVECVSGNTTEHEYLMCQRRLRSEA